jgi:D-threo-aldose 1-dehydrogenase
MQRVAFGPTGLQVTRLCWGMAALGDMPETFAYEVTTDQALATVRAIFSAPSTGAEAGVNFIDTAASYGDGESERRIGLVLRELGGLPAGFVLATKADRDLQTGDFSGDQIRRSVERSARLLGLDRLQVVYLHDPEHTSFEAAMSPGGPVDVLLDYKRQGVIEHVGVAGGPIPLMIQFVETGAFEAVISHNRYTLLNQAASPLFDLAAQRGMAVLNAAPYGSGILAKGPDAYARYAYQDAPREMVERTRRLADECAGFDVPLAAAALQFSTRDPRLTSTIVGISRPERIQQTLELAQVPIPEALWPRLAPYAAPGSAEDPEAQRWR